MRWLWVLVLAVGCLGGPEPASDDTGDTDASGDELLGVGVSPNGPFAEVGEEIQFVAKAFFADTSNQDVTDQMSWVSTETRVATVDAAGLATARSEGVTDIVATSPGGVSAKVRLTVKAEGVKPSGLQLSPASLSLQVGEVVEMSAIASYPDGTGGNVGASCTWSSDAPGVVAMDGSEASGIAAGETTVRAQCPGGLAATAEATVGGAGGGSPDLRVVEAVVEGSGDAIELLVEVENRGAANAGGFFLDVFLDPGDPPVAGAEADDTIWIAGLAPGQWTITGADLVGLADGEHAVWLLVDGDDRIDESDEANNRAGPYAVTLAEEGGGGPTGGPQLLVRSFEGLSDGAFTTWEITVENTGTETARDFFVDLWFDHTGSVSVCEYGDDYTFVEALAPGATTTWSPEVDDGPSFAWDSLVFVDSCDDVAETDESDNLADLTVYAE